MKISALKPLEKNPFKLKGDAELDGIAKSIQSFEKMMSIRKIVIDEDNQILGGNKRYYALKQLGYKTIPDEWIDKRTDLSEAEKREFIVKDNSHWGSTWDYELLAEWEVPLVEWGVPLEEKGYFQALLENEFNEGEEEKVPYPITIVVNEMDYKKWLGLKAKYKQENDLKLFLTVLRNIGE